MDWFEQLRQVLAAYYPASADAAIVGYLQGSVSPDAWRQMASTRNRHQMLILGSLPPTQQDWVDAGVAHRGNVNAVRIGNLQGWIVLYGGFTRHRPWGQLFELSGDAVSIGFPGSLNSWRRNTPRG